jgi:hemolysin activation/secretion protein
LNRNSASPAFIPPPETKKPLLPLVETPPDPASLVDSEQVRPDSPTSLESIPLETHLQLTAIQLEGVTVFSEQELQPLLASWLGKEVRFQDLQALTLAITRFYAEQGYVTSYAYLPPQAISHGELTVRVVEGRLGQVRMEGGKYVRPGYVARRLTLKSGEVLRLSTIERQMAILNRNPLLSGTQAILTPGQQSGTSDLTLQVSSERPWHASVFADNAGRSLVGLYRSGVILSHDNLLGRGDRLVSSTVAANGTFSTLAEYQLPLNRHDWTLSASYAFSRIKLGHSSEILATDLTGTNHRASLTLAAPLYQSTHWEAQSEVSANYYTGKLFQGGMALEEKPGLSSFDRVTALGAGLSVNGYPARGSWRLHGGVEQGIAGLAGSNQAYWRLLADGFFARQLPMGWTLLLRGQGQWSPGSVPALVQYQAGGINSIRGFSEGFLIGDSGYSVSTELRGPFYGLPRKIRESLQWAVFADHGAVFRNQPSSGGTRSATATGWGVGLRGQCRPWLGAQLDVGFMADPVRQQPDAYVHFLVTGRLF